MEEVKEGEALFFDWFDGLSVADRELVLEYLATRAEEIVELYREVKFGMSPDTDCVEALTRQDR